jgi:ribonuclease Z
MKANDWFSVNEHFVPRSCHGGHPVTVLLARDTRHLPAIVQIRSECMSPRELVVLGTAASVPTRERNHNGYALRWDDELLLFDPGEGTQRQMLLAGVSAARITRICITHFHGDHCLGLPGVLQRREVDRLDEPVDVYFPAESAVEFERLSLAARFYPPAVRAHPVRAGHVAGASTFTLHAAALDHRVPALGWRIEEPATRRMLPDRLAAAGVAGPDIGRLAREGVFDVDGRKVFDLLVCEATFLSGDEQFAYDYGHLTAAQAARIAAEAGARQLVLTHFSQRYGDDAAPFLAEARAVFENVVAARDLDRIAVPERSPVG